MRTIRAAIAAAILTMVALACGPKEEEYSGYPTAGGALCSPPGRAEYCKPGDLCVDRNRSRCRVVQANR